MTIMPSTLAQIRRHQARVSPARQVDDVAWRVVGGWRGALAKSTGANAWYDAKADAVCIPAFLAGMAGDVMYAPTITHELTHAAQRQRMGLVAYLAAKTFRRSTLEAEAIAEEHRAQRILGVHVL